MNESDFPALYQSADGLSASSQKFFIYAFVANLICIVGSAVLSTLNYPNRDFAIGQSLLLLVGLGLTFYLAIAKPQEVWYGARALAESIKTMTWRYVMRAEPYNLSDQEARSHFLANLRKLLDANKKISSLAAPSEAREEITKKMSEIRAFNLQERKINYRTGRIDDQRKWYTKKSRFNKVRSSVFLGIIILLYIVMIGFSIARPGYPDVDYWPTDVLLTIASSLLAWTQTKRYQELSASYSLTVREINLLEAELPQSDSEKDFSDFVGDSENAFSREHTQWQARRDKD